jgi:hypothetical protein
MLDPIEQVYVRPLTIVVTDVGLVAVGCGGIAL